MEIKPPRFLIMVTVAIFIFLAAAALLIMQVKSTKAQTEVRDDA